MRTINAPVLLLLSLLLTSCHPGTLVEIVNNAGQTLTVVSMDTELKETAYTLGIGQAVRINTPYKLRVQRSTQVWNYDLPPIPLPQNYRKRVRANWYLEKYQVESDGSIHVLMPDSQTPVSRVPQQPSGFPMQPK
jgi:hypothetical protein